jgi:hypothetical protein
LIKNYEDKLKMVERKIHLTKWQTKRLELSPLRNTMWQKENDLFTEALHNSMSNSMLSAQQQELVPQEAPKNINNNNNEKPIPPAIVITEPPKDNPPTEVESKKEEQSTQPLTVEQLETSPPAPIDVPQATTEATETSTTATEITTQTTTTTTTQTTEAQDATVSDSKPTENTDVVRTKRRIISEDKPDDDDDDFIIKRVPENEPLPTEQDTESPTPTETTDNQIDVNPIVPLESELYDLEAPIALAFEQSLVQPILLQYL